MAYLSNIDPWEVEGVLLPSAEMGFDQLSDMRQLKCGLGPGHCVA